MARPGLFAHRGCGTRRGPRASGVSIRAERIAVKHGKIASRDASGLLMRWNRLESRRSLGCRFRLGVSVSLWLSLSSCRPPHSIATTADRIGGAGARHGASISSRPRRAGAGRPPCQQAEHRERMQRFASQHGYCYRWEAADASSRHG